MNRELFEKYAELKRAEADLVSQINELKPQIMTEMGDNEEVEVDGVGKFVVGKRRVWTYPESIQQAENDLKTVKKEAERLGDATCQENPYVIFKSVV